MKRDDLEEFREVLRSVCSMLTRGQYTPNDTSEAIFFNSLRHHSISEVKAAFQAHCADPQRGRFAPVPADILAQIEAAAIADGRPDDAEAWALALRAANEASTVVWTEEIAESWGICRSVMEIGDEVGARMAFKSAYNRLTSDARSRREPARWMVSEGHDQSQRDDALRIAVESGRLPPAYLPAPRGPVAGLLELSKVRGCPDAIRERLMSIRAQVIAREEEPSTDYANKLRTQDLKAEAEALVNRAKGGNHGV